MKVPNLGIFQTTSGNILKATTTCKLAFKLFNCDKKASSFKYRLNVFYKEDKIYLQLKGTIGYDNKKKLWVNCSLGSISYDELKAIDKQEIVLKHKTVMQEKAKDAILNQFLK